VKCNNDLECTECSAGLFPDPTGLECMIPFTNCAVDQPEGLVVIEVEVESDDEVFILPAYYCPQCDEGYTFDWIDPGSPAWNCEICDTAIPNCDFCDNDGTCRQCADGYTLSYDSYSCFPDYVNCLDVNHTEISNKRFSDPTDGDYWFEYDDWKCSECDVGYYWIDIEDTSGGCVGQCSDFDNRCNNCDFEGICTDCGCEWMPNQEGVCVDKIKNCQVALEDQPDGLIQDEDGNYICDECLETFGFDAESG